MPSSTGTMGSQSEASPTPLLGSEAQALLIACNQKLQELGIDDTIKLPQIAILGDQSTGKSSLIEALSTIQVPKARGCCTQCPIAINLSSGVEASSPWKCSIFIEEHYDFDQSREAKVTKLHPFGQWHKRSSLKIVPVKTTFDKDEVPELIRAAQSAILSPGSKIHDFLGQTAKGAIPTQTIKFSPNVIRLDVSEGTWGNLSFIDLPGVIANTAQEKDKWLVKLIKNLVQEYAAADRSVNMLTLPMTHDIENSQACAIVQELKAEGHTLAVFTKADLADDDQRTEFLRRFTGGDDLGFRHGYHFVALPDGITQDEAREVEAEVFGSPPWSHLDGRHQARLGVNHLRKHLRDLLFKKVKEALPGNLLSIQSRLNQVDAELHALPPPPNAALLPLKLQQSVTQFENAMKMVFTDGSTTEGTSARIDWTKTTTKFKNAVARGKPTLFLLSSSERGRLSKAKSKIQKKAAGGEHTNAIELTSGDEADAPTSLTATAERTANETKDELFDAAHRFHLEDIREINERYYQACVPGEIEVRAVEEMNKLSVEHWDELLLQFMGASSKLLGSQVNETVKGVFSQFQHLEVFSVIQEFVKKYIISEVDKEWRVMQEVCRLEQARPFTYDVQRLKAAEAECVETRRQKRMEKRLDLFKTESEADGVAKPKKKAADSDLGPDPYETELLMSAKTRAYYEVASARFVDTVCLGLYGRLLPTCAEKLVEDLKDHLGLNNHTMHDQIIAWMAEDPERETKRQRLLQEKKRLSEGSQYIQNALGTNLHSPSKRHHASDPDAIELPPTPSKRPRTAHTYRPERLRSNAVPRTLEGRVQSLDLEQEE